MNRDIADISLKTKMPGPKARALVKRDKEVQAKSTDVYAFVRAYDSPAAGPFCTDIDGNILLDFTGQIGSAPLGYNNPKILEIFKNLDISIPTKYAGTDFYAASSNNLPSPTDLKEKIIEATAKFGFEKVFLSNSGAEAVENAIKICYAKTQAKYGICFEGAFHGRTLGALSLNNSKKVHTRGFPSIPYVKAIPYCTETKEECNCGFWAYDKKQRKTVSKLEQLLNYKTGIRSPKEIAFIIIEPVLGEGGYRIPSKEFMKEIKDITEAYGIPLIADEVQTGLGRTGKLWAVEHFDITPDVITAAKPLQVGATIGKEEMFPKEGGRIASTWGGGDIINSIIGYKSLEIIMEDRLWENAKQMGDYFVKQLQGFGKKYACVTEARGLGLMDVMEFEKPEQRNKFEEECFNRGLMVLGCGYTGLRFLPPLDVRKREIDIALNVIEDSLKAV
ncbi:MAG: aspartate aminotransferase family protein [Candidatus Woesearchaeota archaeon]